MSNVYVDSNEPPPLPIPPRRPSTDKPGKPLRSSSERRSNKGRERVPSASRDLARLLVYEEREAKDLQRMLYNVTEQLRAERQRADDAERRVQDVTSRLKTVNDARLVALQDAARANEELRLYKVQLDTAQKEIFRAQEVLQVVDSQRYQAEKDAAKARTAARRLNEEKLIQMAREDGRRMGIREGLERGRDLGFQEGRVTGYAQARPPHIMEDEDEHYEEDNQTPSSEDLYETERHYGVPRTHIHPPSLPASAPLVVPPPTSINGDIHPTIIHSIAPSPRHPYVNIPPDGFIPETGLDSVIRLPPPHEMSRPPPTPQPSPTPPLPPIPEAEEEPLRVPAPAISQTPRSMNGSHRVRRRSSPESNSTTISQFDMVNDPEYSNGRRTPMSIIPEVLSVHTSPNPQGNRGTPGLQRQPSLTQSGSSTVVNHITMTVPTPRTATTNIAGLEDHARHGKYTRPRSSSSSSDSSQARMASAARLMKPRRGSISSLNTVPDITIQPPSRPPSNISREHIEPRRMGDLLSPADAHRPMPLPDRSNGSPSSSQLQANTPATPLAPPPGSDQPTPMTLPDGQLPPGFVPSGFTPGVSADPLLPPLNMFDDSATTAIPIPGSYYDRHLQTSSQYSNDVVIPDLALFKNTLDSDSEVSSGMSSDANTLSTPPGRSQTRAKSNYTGGSQFTAAGVPLPPSTVSGTPRSALGSGYAYTPVSEGGGRTRR